METKVKFQRSLLKKNLLFNKSTQSIGRFSLVGESPTILNIYEVKNTTKPTNPKDSCGIKKVPMNGMPMNVLMEAGLVKLHGDLKYGRFNWREAGVRGSVYYDAAIRHLAAWYEGEDIDPDSGIHHISHAITGLAVLRDSMIRDNWTDDRPPPSEDGWMKELNVIAAKMIENKLK